MLILPSPADSLLGNWDPNVRFGYFGCFHPSHPCAQQHFCAPFSTIFGPSAADVRTSADVAPMLFYLYQLWLSALHFWKGLISILGRKESGQEMHQKIKIKNGRNSPRALEDFQKIRGAMSICQRCQNGQRCHFCQIGQKKQTAFSFFLKLNRIKAKKNADFMLYLFVFLIVRLYWNNFKIKIFAELWKLKKLKDRA